MARKHVKKRKMPQRRDNVAQAYNDFTAALENVYSEIDVVGESVDMLGERIDRKIGDIVTSIEQLERRLAIVEEKVDKIGKDMDFVKIEIRMVRHDLGQKVNREEFHLLEERVEKLEKELAVR